MSRRPLSVTVIWDDAADRYHETCTWDGTFETLRRIPETVKPYLGRESLGYLGFIDESWVYIASDWDAEDKELGKWAVIPLGWISKITTANGRVLYSRHASTPKARGANGRARAAKRGVQPA